MRRLKILWRSASTKSSGSSSSSNGVIGLKEESPDTTTVAQAPAEISPPLELARVRTPLYPHAHTKLLLDLLPEKGPEQDKKEEGEERGVRTPAPNHNPPIQHVSTRHLLRTGIAANNPDPDALRIYAGYLIHLSGHANKAEFLEATLGLMARSNVQLMKSHHSAILSAMNAQGWHDEVKETFCKMTELGIGCRLGTLFALLTSAVWRRDFEFALELMRRLIEGAEDKIGPLNLPIERVVEGCVGAGEEGVELMKLVLKWYDTVECGLDKRSVDILVKWIHRYNYTPSPSP